MSDLPRGPLSRLWSAVVPRGRRSGAAVVSALPRPVIAAPSGQSSQDALASRHFRRLSDVIEQGRLQLGGIALNQESAATQIEAAEHAYTRLLLEISDLLARPVAGLDAKRFAD